jgi:hypothetical protein
LEGGPEQKKIAKKILPEKEHKIEVN